MEATVETKSLIVRIKEYMGQKEGQTFQEFCAELKALTEQDRADLTRWFNEAGMPTK